jgi:glycosyltransferase involved in cell wall biosynthesis
MTCNKNIVFCGYDLEQKLYRGINFYIKATVKVTKDMGYKNYIVTGARSEKNPCLQELSVVRNLETQEKIGKKKVILRYLKDLLNFNQFKVIEKNYINAQEIPKLDYLSYVDGYINKTSIYEIIGLQSRMFDFPYSLDIKIADILFATCPMNIKNKNKKGFTIQTLHDIIPLVCAYHPPKDSSRIFYKRVKSMLNYSDMIFSVSEFSRQELLKIFPKYEEKIHVTHQPVPINEEEKSIACEELFQKATLSKYNLEKSGYLLFVGVLEKRKNIESIIDAYLAIKEKINMPLVLVGSLGYGSDKVKKIIKTNNSIRQIGYVSNLEKLVLLKNANLFVFPSFYEGFGLPPLEAMTMGCPVLTSNTSALPEVCKDAALYVNPNNLVDIIEGILELVNNSSLRSELVQKGYEVSGHFSFENYQRKIQEIMRAI